MVIAMVGLGKMAKDAVKESLAGLMASALKKTGRGVYTWANGAFYDGEWEESRMIGRGVFTSANGYR